MTDSQKDLLILGGIAAVGVGFFILHQIVVPAKVAPINLVPSGSEAATNQNSAAVGVANAQSLSDQAYINAQANVLAQQNALAAQLQSQQLQAQQNAAIAGAAGNVVGSIIGAITGGDSYSDSDYNQ